MAKVKTLIGNVRGPEGLQGKQGIQGPRGIPGITILGSYGSVAALNAAHPTGAAGDGYLVGIDLYVWSETDKKWINAGPVQGPPGDSGVYVGSGMPPSTATVWIDPDGEPTSTELWTFEMEDGTTETKTVVVVG